ncbi:MAG: hypothetical protein E6G97_18655 [Alphaproteobacteria bacterium]|nr:MAG: hypothetical protein E6G97_18655 [Alphaproteobacteria bacterium]
MATNDYKALGLRPGDLLAIYGDWDEPYEAKVHHLNAIGQPYVMPDGPRSPRYLFTELVVVIKRAEEIST